MKTKDLYTLTEKFLQNSISDEELNHLEELLKMPENLSYFKEHIQDDYLLKTQDLQFIPKEKINKILESSLGNQKGKIFTLKNYYKYAAVILLLIGSIITFQHINTNFTVEETIDGNEIVLVVHSGEKHYISPKDADTIFDKKTNQVIAIINEGVLRYSSSSSLTPKFNTLTVPSGKRMNVKLPDQTFIAINSATTITYPIVLESSNNRLVSLKGEAFFDVTTNPSKPFLVKTGDIDIKVLGTRFNVSSFPDDQEIQTTLEEGSVKIRDNRITDNEIILAPNEQSVWNKNSQELSKSKVDISPYIDWTNGKLTFKDERFDNILKKLQRFYNVKIINNNSGLGVEKFTASFENETIDQILFYFSKSYDFTYKKRGKNILIE